VRRPWLVSPWRRARRVLGLNARNLLYVQALNARKDFPLADNKLETKLTLARSGVRIPRTLAVLTSLAEVSRARELLIHAGQFALKPARGRQGGGIVIIAGHDGKQFLKVGGGGLTWTAIQRVMGDILHGAHSAGRPDVVLVEQRVIAHPSLGPLADFGLPDVRVILLESRPMMCMLRVPTRASGGRSNLHQGALGVALRESDGMAIRCVRRGEPLDAHPDSGAPMTGFRMPFWEPILDLAQRAGRCLPLGYLGADIVLDAELGPLVMEMNARPGLEIQNVNGLGLRRRLERAVLAGACP